MEKQQAVLSIFDKVGRSCVTKVIMLEKGNHRFTLENPLKTGFYIARVDFAKGQITTRFMKL